MKHSHFSLYTKNLKNGPVWYARFYNPETEKYDIYRSTGIPNTGRKGKRDEAYKIATGLLSTIKIRTADPLFLDYIQSFWMPGSPYLKFKELSEHKPLSKEYIHQNTMGITKHVLPYERFKKLHLSDLKPGVIEDWKLSLLENGLGTRRLNAILQSIRIPVKYAYERQELASNPFQHVKQAHYEAREKGILNQAELATLLTVQDDDPRVTLSVFLAALCGLRRGEVRGLRWGDIDQKTMLIHVQHNFIDGEGTKACKWGSERTIILPNLLLPTILDVRSKSAYTEPDDFVLFGLIKRKEPISRGTVRGGFTRMLIKAGISTVEQKKRNLTFHGLRHTFVTLARISGLPDIMVQALAGHKSSEMMDHYSHGRQAMDFDKARKMFDGM